MKTFQNPILPGCYPDPSICRAGEDYYLVTSTFLYFPGLPVFHSRDLVHWRQIGHVLDRPSQLNLDGISSQQEPDGVRATGGLYAPTIRCHNGTFYVINTLVQRSNHSRNFIVKAEDPAGPWSEPVWLEDAPGIDPSLFVDDDGRVWYTGNRVPPSGEQYNGHREIWLQEFDPAAMQLTGPKFSLWDGALKGAIHAEAPHLYKIGGMYYLMIAEGGTHEGHAVTIARSRNVTGPYMGNPHNPILTHRHLGLDSPIIATGHADLVETQNGEWWMVMLAIRPYGGHFFNLGRETFLAPVRWEEGWPIVSPGRGRVEFEYPVPNLPGQPWPARPARDHFKAAKLDGCWNFIRTPREDFYSLAERQSHLRLRLRPQTLSEETNPSFVGRRQQHINFSASAAMDFSPQGADECAGIVLLQNSKYHFRFVIAQAEGKGPVVRLVKRENGVESILAEKPVKPQVFTFKVEAVGQNYSFYLGAGSGKWRAVAKNVDGRILSTPVAGGFVGAYIGMYASSNGRPSQTVADFDWFEYRPLSA
jgi:xylan 1,4-beta-xylosidase